MSRTEAITIGLSLAREIRGLQVSIGRRPMRLTLAAPLHGAIVQSSSFMTATIGFAMTTVTAEIRFPRGDSGGI